MKKLLKIVVMLLLALSVSFTVYAGQSSSSEGASVSIISPSNNGVVVSPFKVIFGLSGMGVAPAGVDKKNTGHHHLMVDGNELPDLHAPMGREVKHFGGGQTEVTLELKPGKHTLQLILGDKDHMPHLPPVVSEKIVITVK